jgi:hypothetical protein
MRFDTMFVTNMQQEFRYELAILQDRFSTLLAWYFPGFNSLELHAVFTQANCSPFSNFQPLR